MTVSFTVEYEAAVRDVAGAGNNYRMAKAGTVASVSASLAVALYDEPESDRIRIRGFHPTTGTAYYDDVFWSGPDVDYQGHTKWIVRADGSTAFAVLGTATNSNDSGDIVVATATTSGWDSATYSGVTGIFDRPQADGTSGTAYFFLSVGSLSADDAIWTVDLSDLSRVATIVTIPSDLVNAMIFGHAFRGGVIVAGRGGSNAGTVGHLYWFKIGSGWSDYTGGPAVNASVNEATDVTLLIDAASGSTQYRTVYDPGGDTFITGSLGWRMPNVGSDLAVGDVGWLAINDYRLDLAATLGIGISRYDSSYADTGQQDPYKWRIYATDTAGSYDWYDTQYASAYAPDPVDFNTFLDFANADIEVSGNRFAAALSWSAGSFDGVSTTSRHSVVVLVSGKIFDVGGWHVGQVVGGSGRW